MSRSHFWSPLEEMVQRLLPSILMCTFFCSVCLTPPVPPVGEGRGVIIRITNPYESFLPPGSYKDSILGHCRKVQRCKSQGCTAALKNHPKIPLGGLKWWVLQIKPESTPQLRPRSYRRVEKSPQKSPGGAKMVGLTNTTKQHR